MTKTPAKDSANGMLSRETIATKALEIADQCGIENVSMRKLAGELGKTAMALYRYYDSIDDIRAAAVARAFSEVDTLPVPYERWDDTLRRTTYSIRDMYLRHSRANLAFVRTTGDSTALKAHTDRIYNLYVEQGMPPEILEKAWRIIDAFLTGFIANETFEMQTETDHQTEGSPAWAHAVSHAYSKEAFRDGIEIIISGIAALADADSDNWRTPA